MDYDCNPFVLVVGDSLKTLRVRIISCKTLLLSTVAIPETWHVICLRKDIIATLNGSICNANWPLSCVLRRDTVVTGVKKARKMRPHLDAL